MTVELISKGRKVIPYITFLALLYSIYLIFVLRQTLMETRTDNLELLAFQYDILHKSKKDEQDAALIYLTKLLRQQVKDIPAKVDSDTDIKRRVLKRLNDSSHLLNPTSDELKILARPINIDRAVRSQDLPLRPQWIR